MEDKLIKFIKQPTVFRSVYFVCCMTLAFGLGIITEHSLQNQGNNPVVQIPEKPMPLALRYKTSTTQNIYDTMPAVASQPISETTDSGKNFVASKTGTKYYPADCTSTSRIKEENRIYFATEKEAEEKGYTRTTTCQ